jgi:hypothetical protein
LFHGIEELRKTGSGYVSWRGVRVDHYSFSRDEAGQAREREAAHELAQQCRHLETLGVHVRRVDDFSWFASMTPATPAVYLAFVGVADDFLEHPDGSLAWQFAHDPRVKGEGQEDTEVASIYVWKGGTLERRQYTGRVSDAGIYHVLRADGWEPADCGQGRTSSGDHRETLWGVTWDQLHALFERHGLTLEALATHVLTKMPTPPPPPKPIATLDEAKRALVKEITRSVREGEPEADNDLNDASRVVVHFMAKEHGEAWLGMINLYGEERHGGAPILWLWDGTPIHNYGAAFVCPKHDAELERLIRERDDAPYTGMRADATRVEAIMARVEEAGGIHLAWT